MKKKKNNFIILRVGTGVVAFMYFILSSNAVLALDAMNQATQQHPAMVTDGQLPSRTLFKGQQGGAGKPESMRGRETAMAKMNQILFRESIQALTAPNAFRAQKPAAPERPNPNRIERNR
ncbi:MAG: hypothetical protein ABH845_04470 [Candidatus Omnitrophota bacterium]